MKKYNKEKLRKHQLDSANLLKRLALFLEDNKIDYFIGAGTLLGAVRHGGFIPWDDDIDIFLSYTDHKRFLNLIIDKEVSYFYEIMPEVKQYQSHIKIFSFSKESSIDVFFIHYYKVCFFTKYLRKYYKKLITLAMVLNFFSAITSPYKRCIQGWFPLFLVSYPRILYPKTGIRYFLLRILLFFRFLWRLILPFFALVLLNLLRLLQSKNGKYCFLGPKQYFDFYFGEKDFLFPTKKISFEGVIVRAPRNPEAALSAYFRASYAKFPSGGLRPYHFKFDE